MKINVSETTDIQLEWLVAKCEGHDVVITTIAEQAERFNNALLQYGEKPSLEAATAVITGLKPRLKHGVHLVSVPSYSTDWAQGGPILDREDIDIYKFKPNIGIYGAVYSECHDGRWCRQFGETRLVAGLRCFVASELGDEVDIPEELA